MNKQEIKIEDKSKKSHEEEKAKKTCKAGNTAKKYTKRSKIYGENAKINICGTSDTGDEDLEEEMLYKEKPVIRKKI